ncbi:MAG: formate dehydrogenase accessory sulfurtransferase FdhD [Spirochaetes bacterium]|nr:formate dehydrogenase accessory sulfurtransferase FdhD [Spirochaetota bacterium]
MEKREMYELRRVTRIKDGIATTADDPVVREAPLTIMLNNEELATLVCSPVADKELVIGFLAGEGLLKTPEDIRNYEYRKEEGVARVEAAAPAPRLEGFPGRIIAGSCGKCGPSFYAVKDASGIGAVTGDPRFSADHVLSLVKGLDEGSATFRLTGGVHTAALGDAAGIIARYEDIGRHNALDRIMGYVFLNGIDTSDKAVVLSGRVASEMLLKAARIGVPVVLSRSAPTALALDLAGRLGITVVGFVRGNGFNVYCHGERIVD